MSESVYELVELAQRSGKIKKGINEVIKCVEKGTAKAVIVAQDISPKELVMHLPLLCKEKSIPYFEVPSKDNLGASAQITRGTAAVAVLDAGEGKDVLSQLSSKSASKE